MANRRWPFGRNALTASVSVVPRERTLSGKRSLDAGWQGDAWEFYKTLGEIRYSAHYIGNSLARCRFFVGTRDHPGDPVAPIPDDGPPEDLRVRDQLERIRGRDGTFASLVRVYGIQQFIAGESFLVGEDGLDGERWEFISNTEKREIDRRNVAGATANQTDEPDVIQVDQNSILIRFWQRDPEIRNRADSSMRAVLDICNNLRTAQAMQTAGDRSRLASAGILAIPKGANLPKVVGTEGNDVGPGVRPRLQLLDDLMDAMEASMRDPSSVEAIVPILVEMEGDLIEKMQRVTFERDVDKTLGERMDRLLNRLGIGLEIPPEVLKGLADLNHWSAWAVAESTISAHIVPMAAAFCEDLTVGFLHPSLEALANMKDGAVVNDIERYAIGFDVTDLVVAPNRDEHALALWDRFLLDNETAVETLGFDPDQQPDEEEIKRRLEIIQAEKGPAAPPNPNGQNPNQNQDGQPGQSDQGQPADTPPPRGDNQPDKGPPSQQDQPSGQDQQPPDQKTAVDLWSLAGRMAGACDAAIETGDFERLRGRLTEWVGSEPVADRLAAASETLALQRESHPGLDVLGAVSVFCEAALGLSRQAA